MNHTLLISLLQSLLQIGASSFPPVQKEEALAAFSSRYCYNAVLQPCYTADHLNISCQDLPERTVFELQDSLGIRTLMLRVQERIFLIGPFVTAAFEETRIRTVLIGAGLSAAFLPSLRLYFSAFPQVSRQSVYHTLRALLRVLYPAGGDYAYRTFTGSTPEPERKSAGYRTQFDYESIQKRYELENRFLRSIEEGDTAHVLDAFSSMEISDLNTSRYINAVYFRPETSIAMVRALARKAAERGGAPLMEINEITQRAVQTSVGSLSLQAAGRNLHRMITELTEAVRRHKEEEGHYSPPVQKVVSYLRFNYSQEISLEQLARIALLAPSYLSRQFKEETGRTISQTLRQLRCAQAAKLLKETGLPIAEISAYVGYPDSNYFVKVFRKQYGMTPGTWRSEKENR